MRSDSELEALRLKTLREIKKKTGADLTDEILSKVACALFEEGANHHIRAHVAHLPLGDLLNFIRLLNDRPEVEEPAGPAQLPTSDGSGAATQEKARTRRSNKGR